MRFNLHDISTTNLSLAAVFVGLGVLAAAGSTSQSQNAQGARVSAAKRLSHQSGNASHDAVSDFTSRSDLSGTGSSTSSNHIDTRISSTTSNLNGEVNTKVTINGREVTIPNNGTIEHQIDGHDGQSSVSITHQSQSHDSDVGVQSTHTSTSLNIEASGSVSGGQSP